MTPERMRKTRKASMNLRREGVESMYAVQRDCRAKEDGEDDAGLVSEGACFAVLDEDLGPAIWVYSKYVTTWSLAAAVIRRCPGSLTPSPNARDSKLELTCCVSCTLLPGASQEQAVRQHAQCGYLQVHGAALRQLPRLHHFYVPLRHVETTTSGFRYHTKLRMEWVTFSHPPHSRSSRRTTSRVCWTVLMTK